MNQNTEKNYYRTESKGRIVISQLAVAGRTVSIALFTMNTYLATESYGISLIILGSLMIFLKVFDAFLTPTIGIVTDRICTRFGKIRILLMVGGLLQIFGIYMLFCRGTDKYQIAYYVVMYLVYGIGWAIYGCGCDIIAIVSTTDPALRSFTNAVGSGLRIIVPALMGLFTTLVILRRYDNIYSKAMLAASGKFYVGVLIFFTVLACIGVSTIDKPEKFQGIRTNDSVSYKELIRLLKENVPLKTYLVSQVSDKVAADLASAQVVSSILLFGIIMNNYQLGSILKVATTLIGGIMIAFASKGIARKGSRAAVIIWSRRALICTCIMIVFCLLGGWNYVFRKPLFTLFFVLCYMMLYGSSYCVSSASFCLCADITDYELNRSGRYLPSTIVSLYTLVEQTITAVDTLLISLLLSTVGYTTTSPQISDPCTTGVKVIALILNFGIYIITLGMNLIAMKYNFLTKEKMEEIQKENYESLQELKQK